MRGTISSYMPENGYGFIKGSDGKDYFVHARDFLSGEQINHLII